jgi:hypothetical protein
VDGDGFPDIAVGAPDNDNGGNLSGMVRVFSGADYAVIGTIDGSTANDFFGYAVDGGYDINGDGFDDLAVGAPGEFGSGTAYAISGRDGSTIWRWSGDAIGVEFGNSVALLGDVNGDGFADVAVGAHLDDNTNGTDAGLVRVFSGRTGGVLYTVLGATFDDRFGYSVHGAGDVNHDAIPDLVVGAPREFGAGSAYALRGQDGFVIWRPVGDDIDDRFGHSVRGLGDVDGDEFHDFAVGAPDDDNGGGQSGSVRLFSGRTGVPLFTWHGAMQDDHFGTSVALADVDADGFDDVIAGVPGSDVGGTDSGRVSVYDLGSVGTPARAIFFGRGCAGSNGHLPRIDYRDRPFLGHSFDILLRGAAVNAPVMITFAPRQDVSLTPFGYPGCRAHAITGGAYLFLATDANGMSALRGIPLPNAPQLIGVRLACQWLIADAAANAGGATSSSE